MESLSSELTDKIMEENLRVNITLSPYVFKKLRDWAKLHGKTPSAYAGQIVSARVEANLDIIERMLNEYAVIKGISTEELNNLWSADKD